MTELNRYEFSKRENIALYSGIFAAGLVISYLMYRNLLFAAVIIPFSGRIKGFVREIIIKDRRRRYMSEFKDFLFMVSTAVGAGRSMKDAVSEAIPSLKSIYGNRSVLTKDLILAYERMDKGGENDVRVLNDLAGASGLEDVQDFVTVYSICKETGADLISALNKAASVIMDKMSIEREIDEIIKRKENEGLVIFAMPALIIMFLNLTAPDYISPLYETIAGRIIMTAVTAASIGIYAMIQRITNVEI